jgi:hypothetical protein
VNELEAGCSARGVRKEPSIGRFAVILERQNAAADELATPGSDRPEARRTLPANLQRDHGQHRSATSFLGALAGGFPRACAEVDETTICESGAHGNDQ